MTSIPSVDRCRLLGSENGIWSVKVWL